jgi:hypothetical protein
MTKEELLTIQCKSAALVYEIGKRICRMPGLITGIGPPAAGKSMTVNQSFGGKSLLR